MTNPIFQLENLPNELVIELFKYFSSEDLFQAFYNLNQRLNNLIQSLTHLTYSTNKINNSIHSYPYIRTLIIDGKFNDTLEHFSNVRRLILDYVTEELLVQLKQQNLPNLEYISISHKVHPLYIYDLRDKIFTNTFLNLKYCYISRIRLPSINQPWTQLFSLTVLKLNDIDSNIYTSILVSCPNLHYLTFKLSIKSKIESNLVRHEKLKRLIINMNYDNWPWEDSLLEDYLLCAPYLEQFRLSRSISIDLNMLNYLKYYDWLFPIISSHSKFLHQFKFDLYANRSYRFVEFNFQEVSHQLKRNFNNIYKYRYHSRLMIF